ncbi:hypothetical protein AAFF_G00394770 [Aldrovandia affinis]|uniref:Podoplanin n=1 Tax=Aldrovandia affinis TaxID=143900 RepID=A0AAD7WL08_9TELE|nr:hypothetical protein AAFF_G00394770 [Aldrovandia affinis]
MIRVQLLLLLALAGHLCTNTHARPLVGQTVAEAENLDAAVAPDVPETVKEEGVASPPEDKETQNTTEAYAIPPEVITEAPPPEVIPICVPAATEATTLGSDDVGATIILLEEKPTGVSRGLVLGTAFVSLLSLIAVGSAGKVVSRKVGRYSP